jgi:hypothetical protein
MPKYEDLSKAFAASAERQAQYVNDCCAFATFLFAKMGAYLAWPSDQIVFGDDEEATEGQKDCAHTRAVLGGDGYVYVIVLCTVRRFDNIDRAYQFVVPTKLRKLEESFLVRTRGLSEEFMLNKDSREELHRFFDSVSSAMKEFFETPFLDVTAKDFLRVTLSDTDSGFDSDDETTEREEA